MTRELHSHRMERALESTLRTARDARRQLASVLQHSNDAIAQVQEGILVDANASWLGLLRLRARGARRPAHHGPVRGDHPCGVEGRAGRLPAGPLERPSAEHRNPLRRWQPSAAGSGAGAGRARWRTVRAADHRLAQAASRASSRRTWRTRCAAIRPPACSIACPCSTAVNERLATPVRAGVRYFAVVKPDKFATVERDVGLFASEDVLAAFTTRAARRPARQ